MPAKSSGFYAKAERNQGSLMEILYERMRNTNPDMAGLVLPKTIVYYDTFVGKFL